MLPQFTTRVIFPHTTRSHISLLSNSSQNPIYSLQRYCFLSFSIHFFWRNKLSSSCVQTKHAPPSPIIFIMYMQYLRCRDWTKQRHNVRIASPKQRSTPKRLKMPYYDNQGMHSDVMYESSSPVVSCTLPWRSPQGLTAGFFLYTC